MKKKAGVIIVAVAAWRSERNSGMAKGGHGWHRNEKCQHRSVYLVGGGINNVTVDRRNMAMAMYHHHQRKR